MSKKLLSIAMVAAAVVAITLGSCKKGGWQQYKPGIEYQMYDGGKGEKIGDSAIVTMHFVQKAGDSVIGSTYVQNHGEPVIQFLVKNPNDKSFNFTELFFKLRQGDSMIVRLNADSAFGAQKPPFIKPTDKLTIGIKVVEIYSKAKKDSFMAEQMKMQAAQQASMAEQQEKEMVSAAKLAPVEDAKIKAYIAKNGIANAQKTSSGLYYAIVSKGTGALPQNGQQVTMNYTGTLLDGTVFDSNQDPKFNHNTPLTFGLGTGQVIRGWDEGIALLPVGTKAILIIPSYLAYGSQAREGSPIKANSILRFDLEVVSAK